MSESQPASCRSGKMEVSPSSHCPSSPLSLLLLEPIACYSLAYYWRVEPPHCRACPLLDVRSTLIGKCVTCQLIFDTVTFYICDLLPDCICFSPSWNIHVQTEHFKSSSILRLWWTPWLRATARSAQTFAGDGIMENTKTSVRQLHFSPSLLLEFVTFNEKLLSLCTCRCFSIFFLSLLSCFCACILIFIFWMIQHPVHT